MKNVRCYGALLLALVFGSMAAFAARTPKAVFDADKLRLSFYCDEADHAAANNKVFKIGDYGSRSWQGVGSVTQVVFDASFRYFRTHTLQSWFSEMTKLQEIIGPENIDTSQVVSMYDTFRNNHSIKVIDISAWNLMNVKNINGTFKSLSVQKIYAAPDFALPQCTTNNFPFSYTWALVGCEGTKWAFGMESVNYARIDGGNLEPGMFTRKLPEFPPFIRRISQECCSDGSVTIVIDGFRLYCGTITVELKKGGQTVTSHDMTDFGEVTFECLEPSTTYQVFVRAENPYGSVEDNNLKFTTVGLTSDER